MGSAGAPQAVIFTDGSSFKYTYLEFSSKTHSGGIHGNTDSKVATTVATDSFNKRVRFLDLYMSKVPACLPSEGSKFLPDTTSFYSD